MKMLRKAQKYQNFKNSKLAIVYKVGNAISSNVNSNSLLLKYVWPEDALKNLSASLKIDHNIHQRFSRAAYSEVESLPIF